MERAARGAPPNWGPREATPPCTRAPQRGLTWGPDQVSTFTSRTVT